VVPLAFGVILLSILVGTVGPHPAPIAAIPVFLAGIVLFYCLTVEIGDNLLEIRFGTGLIRKSFEIKDIERAYPVRNRWYYGWGIRLTPHGWLFNISGLDAVEIVLTSGKRYRIGTDEPERLAEEITGAIRQAK